MKGQWQKYLFLDIIKVSLKITATDSGVLHRCWYFNNQKRGQQKLGFILFFFFSHRGLSPYMLKIIRRLLSMKD